MIQFFPNLTEILKLYLALPIESCETERNRFKLWIINCRILSTVLDERPNYGVQFFVQITGCMNTNVRILVFSGAANKKPRGDAYDVMMRFATEQLLLTKWSRLHLGKLTGPKIINIFPTFHGTWSFITVFTRSCHLYLSWARSIQSTPKLLDFFQKPFLILSPSIPRSSKQPLSLTLPH